MRASGITWLAFALAPPRPKCVEKWPAQARSCGGKRVPAGLCVGSIRSPPVLWRHHAWARPARLLLSSEPQDGVGGALRSALAAKLRDGELKVVSAWNVAEPKTKVMASVLKNLETDRSVLLVNTLDVNRNLELGSRNLPGVKLVATHEVNAYDLLAHKHVVLSEAAAKKLSEALA